MLVSALFSFQRHQMLLGCTYVFGDSAYSRGLDYYRHRQGKFCLSRGLSSVTTFVQFPRFQQLHILAVNGCRCGNDLVLTVAQDFRSNSGL